MPRAPKQPWTFRKRFRKRGFGWRSQPAAKRVREAVTEIKAAARKDAILGAEGALLFLEKVAPALELVARETISDRFVTRVLGRELELTP